MLYIQIMVFKVSTRPSFSPFIYIKRREKVCNDLTNKRERERERHKEYKGHAKK